MKPKGSSFSAQLVAAIDIFRLCTDSSIAPNSPERGLYSGTRGAVAERDLTHNQSP